MKVFGTILAWPALALVVVALGTTAGCKKESADPKGDAGNGLPYTVAIPGMT